MQVNEWLSCMDGLEVQSAETTDKYTSALDEFSEIRITFTDGSVAVFEAEWAGYDGVYIKVRYE